MECINRYIESRHINIALLSSSIRIMNDVIILNDPLYQSAGVSLSLSVFTSLWFSAPLLSSTYLVSTFSHFYYCWYITHANSLEITLRNTWARRARLEESLKSQWTPEKVTWKRSLNSGIIKSEIHYFVILSVDN